MPSSKMVVPAFLVDVPDSRTGLRYLLGGRLLQRSAPGYHRYFLRGRDGVDKIQKKPVISVASVPDQLDVTVHLLDSVLVLAVEVASDAQETGCPPLYSASRLGTQCVAHQHVKLGLVVEEPLEVEEPLIDDVLVHGPLVLDDHG